MGGLVLHWRHSLLITSTQLDAYNYDSDASEELAVIIVSMRMF